MFIVQAAVVITINYDCKIFMVQASDGRYDTEHNNIKHNESLNDDTKHNYIQYNSKQTAQWQSIIKLSVFCVDCHFKNHTLFVKRHYMYCRFTNCC
jgi:predicted metal-dependent hydrolase